MPGRHVTQKTKAADRAVAKVYKMAAYLEDDTRDLPDLRDIPLMRTVIEQVINGTKPRGIQKILSEEGYDCGLNRIYSMIKIARQEIAKEGYGDFRTNYSWAQTNLMDIHARAVLSGDDRMRVVVIKELIALWQLTTQPEEDNREITQEMIEEFEQKLLR
jgi:hypothetical protein